MAHGGKEFGEADRGGRRTPADRVVPNFAELNVGNCFTGHVAVDHLLPAACAEFDHDIAHVTRKARGAHDSRVKVHLLSEAVRIAQRYARLVPECPEHAVEGRAQYYPRR